MVAYERPPVLFHSESKPMGPKGYPRWVGSPELKGLRHGIGYKRRRTVKTSELLCTESGIHEDDNMSGCSV